MGAVSGLLLAPVLQLLFTRFTYPGIPLGVEGIRLNLYSGPLLVTFLINIFTTIIVFFFLTEPVSVQKSPKQATSTKKNHFSISEFSRRTWNLLSNANFSWYLVVMISLSKVGTYAAYSTVAVVHSAWSQIAFGWSSPETITKLTSAKISMGILSVLISFAIFKFGKRIGDHIILLVCSALLLGHFVITYPLPGLSMEATPAYNETSRGGCNESEYSWCGARVGNADLWIYSSVIMLVIVSQLALVASDAIFSKLLEKVDQNMMQGMLVVLADAVQMVASIYSADMFTAWGLEPLWILNLVLTVLVLTIAIVFFRKFKL